MEREDRYRPYCSLSYHLNFQHHTEITTNLSYFIVTTNLSSERDGTMNSPSWIPFITERVLLMRFPSDSDTSSDVSPERHHPLDQRHYKPLMEFKFVLSLKNPQPLDDCWSSWWSSSIHIKPWYSHPLDGSSYIDSHESHDDQYTYPSAAMPRRLYQTRAPPMTAADREGRLNLEPPHGDLGRPLVVSSPRPLGRFWPLGYSESAMQKGC